MLRFPRPLTSGATIGVTAASSGVAGAALARLDTVLAALRGRGFRIVEGAHLRRQHQDASAPAPERAAELMRFLVDPAIDAVLPPWGGERAIELLPLLDFDALRARPAKWLSGFSDLSTLQLPLALCAGWASAHGTNLMDMVPRQTDPLVTGALDRLSHEGPAPLVQHASTRYQARGTPLADDPATPLNLTEPTRWRRLDGRDDEALVLQGRLIGGCLDTVSRLAGTRYGDLPRFVRDSGPDGVLLYLENCELSPCEELRALVSLRLHGWFDGLAGLLLGRSAAPPADGPGRLDHEQAVRDALGGLACPVLLDLDIGHRQPQFTLVNGALAVCRYEAGGGSLAQSWSSAP
ncbi:MAG: S66 peptidase family protein [Burkholderiaceae bacterium]